eukprot:gnl/Dysnectes_brevis/6073_a9139_389.p1 GENE.gnl/Dysnectes_brevis/6073_a9139_389~~gnl/Dysnectes_brevis/6073_a9139_389.p1  ORF type:complete len:860 (+),score=70.92 gnl/Dysnectes_brevis/6073_a9139_389:55-2580(+)
MKQLGVGSAGSDDVIASLSDCKTNPDWKLNVPRVFSLQIEHISIHLVDPLQLKTLAFGLKVLDRTRTHLSSPFFFFSTDLEDDSSLLPPESTGIQHAGTSGATGVGSIGPASGVSSQRRGKYGSLLRSWVKPIPLEEGSHSICFTHRILFHLPYPHDIIDPPQARLSLFKVKVGRTEGKCTKGRELGYIDIDLSSLLRGQSLTTRSSQTLQLQTGSPEHPIPVGDIVISHMLTLPMDSEHGILQTGLDSAEWADIAHLQPSSPLIRKLIKYHPLGEAVVTRSLAPMTKSSSLASNHGVKRHHGASTAGVASSPLPPPEQWAERLVRALLPPMAEVEERDGPEGLLNALEELHDLMPHPRSLDTQSASTLCTDLFSSSPTPLHPSRPTLVLFDSGDVNQTRLSASLAHIDGLFPVPFTGSSLPMVCQLARAISALHAMARSTRGSVPDTVSEVSSGITPTGLSTHPLHGDTATSGPHMSICGDNRLRLVLLYSKPGEYIAQALSAISSPPQITRITHTTLGPQILQAALVVLELLRPALDPYYTSSHLRSLPVTVIPVPDPSKQYGPLTLGTLSGTIAAADALYRICFCSDAWSRLLGALALEGDRGDDASERCCSLVDRYLSRCDTAVILKPLLVKARCRGEDDCLHWYGFEGVAIGPPSAMASNVHARVKLTVETASASGSVVEVKTERGSDRVPLTSLTAFKPIGIDMSADRSKHIDMMVRSRDRRHLQLESPPGTHLIVSSEYPVNPGVDQPSDTTVNQQYRLAEDTGDLIARSSPSLPLQCQRISAHASRYSKSSDAHGVDALLRVIVDGVVRMENATDVWIENTASVDPILLLIHK